MNEFETDLINAWLVSLGYFTRVGLVFPGCDSTILATLVKDGIYIEKLQVDSLIRLSVDSYLCPPKPALNYSDEELRFHADRFVQERFKGGRALGIKDGILGDDNKCWRFMLIVNKIRSTAEVDYLKTLGVEIYFLKDIIADLKKIERAWQLPSQAHNKLKLIKAVF